MVALRKQWLRGWESHPPEEVYEASLCALVEFPAVKWWSRWVTLPHQLACRASALLVCHDPIKLARRLGAAPSKLSFGDSVAQAGARRKKIGAVAGNRTRTCSLARSHSAVKSQPRKLKGPEVSLHFRPMPFQQRTNTPWRSTRSQPAVSRRLFRCLGAHLLRSP